MSEETGEEMCFQNIFAVLHTIVVFLSNGVATVNGTSNENSVEFIVVY